MIEGYSTLLNELDTQLTTHSVTPNLVIVPVSIGGLAQAVVTHYSSTPTKILTVEPNTAASLYSSLVAGERKSFVVGNSIITGMNYGTVSEAAWPVLKEGVDISVTVSDEEAVRDVELFKEMGPVNVGYCTGAMLSGLKAVLEEGNGRAMLGLGVDGEGVVVMIGTN